MNPYSEIIESLIALKDMHREELELSEAGEAAGEDKKGEDTEVMMSDERELRIELAILYILNVEDY